MAEQSWKSAIIAVLTGAKPPQNRRRGDDFMAVEYIQDIDPELKEQEIQRTIRSVEDKLRQSP